MSDLVVAKDLEMHVEQLANAVTLARTSNTRASCRSSVSEMGKLVSKSKQRRKIFEAIRHREEKHGPSGKRKKFSHDKEIMFLMMEH